MSASFWQRRTIPERLTNWEFELGSPNTLMRSGWTRNSLKVGDEVIVKRLPLKGLLQPGECH